MSTRYRLICNNCNKIINIDNYHWVCPECHTQVTPDPGFIQVYRKGNYFGMMMPFGVFVDGRQRGVIGNKETMRICVPYGRHVVRIGESQDLIFDITPEQPAAFVRAYMRVGAWKSTMQIEAISQAEMPEGNEPHNISTLASAPSQPVIPPVQPIVTPVTPVVAPVEPVIAPVEPVIAPVEPVVAPVEPVIAPVEPIVTPAEPVVVPVEPIVTPAEPVVVPVEPVVAPVEPVVVPVEPVIAPVEPVVTPAEPVVVPVEPVVAPVEPVVVPVVPVVTPVEPVVAPVEPVIAPVEPVIAPAEPVRDYCFCYNCGTKLSITDKFCFKCGSPVKHG